MSNYKSYSDYYNIFGSDPTSMTFKTFPNYLVAMNASDELEYTKRNYIDSLSVVDSVVYDSVQMTSTPFKNLESLEWNLLAQPSLQRYKLLNSSWIVSDTMLFYNDTFDISAYWSVVDTPFIDYPTSSMKITITGLGSDERASINPAIQLTDMLTNKRFGKALDLENDIDLTSIKESAILCGLMVVM